VDVDAAWLPGFVIAVVMEPWFRLGKISVAYSGLAHFRIAKTLQIEGLRARCPFSRARIGGAVLKDRWLHDHVAVGDLP